MDLDTLLHDLFGTTEVDTLDPETIEAGRERLAVAFGLEEDEARRFALWALLHALGDAPDPRDAFDDPAMQRAAESYARAAGSLGRK